MLPDAAVGPVLAAPPLPPILELRAWIVPLINDDGSELNAAAAAALRYCGGVWACGC